ncbi:NAD(P)/FAD-dependent oxidoreductase [Salipiger sp. P9]|uniref:NAD(P)/FAD-dependent oxidoreductase n=1 Tax=Salipiger pentaromativorans TaxID=2943193 RepID=UPI0021579065|nr:NAD(P)/FAD-dependent oxidoreductase [Salipiger pentaromativorans]MCR8550129.1 NAD(P)/FAD-dependent oxidoreductase [Salipiger pentaromativorans]
MRWNRRVFMGTGAAAAAALSAPMLGAQGRPRVVVVGGGAGGATAARYLAKDSQGGIEVMLVEPTRSYYTCFFSNLYLGGFRTLDSLAHGYGTLAAGYGVNVVHDWVIGVDRDARTVHLAGGASLPYDKLVLSPGIDFVEGAVPGWDLSAQDVMPHAYKAGTQTALLKAQIEAMPQGGTYVMVAPPNPYRCPPGPYERISMVAHHFKTHNPTAKILIADPKPGFSKQALFEEGWERHYQGMVERLGPDFGGGNVRVDPAGMEVDIDGELVKADVVNVIPAQKAGHICAAAGLTEGNWAPVDGHSMVSRMDPDIHILGDASAQGDMPKSGFSANSQAKVAAMAIRGALTGSRVFPAKYSNTCWSLIAPEDGVKVGAAYEPTEEKIASVSSFVSQTGEDTALRKATYEESLGWYDGITADMFG